MNYAELKTLTGIPANEVPTKLSELFADKKAYKGVPGGANLTDINTGFMIERATQTFGLRGLGWRLDYQPEHLVIDGDIKRPTASLQYAVFSYLLVDDGGSQVKCEIPVSGVSKNNLEYAAEGARTSAIGAALKSLCFQLPIYKGLEDHNSIGRGQTTGQTNGKTTAKSNGQTPPKDNQLEKNAENFQRWATGTMGLEPAAIKAALAEIEITSFDIERWDDMIAAVKKTAGK